MTVLPELERQLVRAAARGGERRSRRLWGAVAGAGCLIAALIAVVFAGAGTHHPAARATGAAGMGATVPATYTAACARTGDCATVPAGPVPPALRRPFAVPSVHGACPASPATPFSNSFFGGVSLGGGPVRADIANRVDVPRGRIVLGTTSVPRWYGIKTVWFSLPGYSGPWSVRAVRLSGEGTIDLGQEPARGAGPAIVIPPGPTLNTGVVGSGAGYRTDPRTTWLTAPGCYAWKVDGIGFTELIVFRAVLR